MATVALTASLSIDWGDECEHPATPDKFTIKVNFEDRVSHRVGGDVQRKVVDKLAQLRMAYLNCSPAETWRSVVNEQIWDAESKNWSSQTSWTY